MRCIPIWSAVLAGMVATSAPCSATELNLVPSKPSGFWAGTRLKLVAERASMGRLRVHVEGTVAAKRPGRVSLSADGCAAGTDDISSYNWTPEHHPADRQAVPDRPAYQQSGVRRELRLAGKRRVSFSGTVGYGFSDAAVPGWTDCVRLSLARRPKDGADLWSAFDSLTSTLYVTVSLRDGRHVACGPAPAFCSQRRPSQFLPPALPAFPPAPGYPGSPGYGNPPVNDETPYPYRVCGTVQDGGPFLC